MQKLKSQEKFVLPKEITAIMCIVLLLIVGYIDYVTGFHISLSIFYTVPITIAVWYVNRAFGLMVSLSSALIWFIADYFCRSIHPDMLLTLWNTFVRLCFFLVIWYLLSDLKNKYYTLKKLSMTDPLTDALNLRGFMKFFKIEYNQSLRTKTPFSLAYLDLDNFKKINDTFGHLEGDTVLNTAVKTIKEHIRKSDIIGRIGGDEFVILLKGADRQGAEIVLESLRKKLVMVMNERRWPVTISIGAATVSDFSIPLSEIIRRADESMYSVKQNGKNNIEYISI